MISIPDAVLEILRRLEEAGHETWCVGGAIRDGLIGGHTADVDLATAARPDEVQALFRRTVPVGLAHGTVGVLDDHDVLHEVTTFRRDVRTDGRHAEVEFGVSLDDDLARRDFTINAIAWHPLRGEWRDPFGGRNDLRDGIIRAVGDPAARFREDRLRILRALRFAARFEFTIEADTWAAAIAQGGDTAQLSAERVREEWWKGAGSALDHHELLRLWQASGVAEVWLGGEGVAVVDRPALSAPVAADPLLLLAAWRSPVAPLLTRLKASGAEISRGRGIDRGPAAPEDAEPATVRRWLATTGAAADDLMHLAAAHCAEWLTVARGVRERGEATTRDALAIDGDDLVAAGIAEPGPALGRLLERLLDAVLVDPSCNTRESLLTRAKGEVG